MHRAAQIRLRPLAVADLPILRTLAEEADAEGFQFLNRLVAALQADGQTPQSSTDFFLGALVGARLVAVGGVTADPYTTEPGTGRIRHLYVHPTARARGVGRTLVRALEERARGTYTRLRLRTDNEPAARFYERVGYRPVQDPSATHERVLMPVD